MYKKQLSNKIIAVTIATAMALPAITVTANDETTTMNDAVNIYNTEDSSNGIQLPEVLTEYSFEEGIDGLIANGAEITNSETIYVVKSQSQLNEGEKLDANGLVYTGSGSEAKYVTLDPIGSPSVVEDKEKGFVLQFDPTQKSIDCYRKSNTSKTDDMDEETAKHLDFQVPVNDYYYVEADSVSNAAIETSSQALDTQNVSSEIKVANPFAGLSEELKEYDELDDVDVKKYGNRYCPIWNKGVTVSYWIKVPVDEKGQYKNSSVLRWENDNEYYFQADDYARHLPTKLFDRQYALMTDEQKDSAKKYSPSGVFYYGKAEYDKTFLDPDGLLDFYFEYEAGYSKKDENGYVVADNIYTDDNGNSGPVYNYSLIQEMQAAIKGKTKFTASARFFYANPNYVEGFYKAADGSFYSIYDTATYNTYNETPVVINASGEAVKPESSYIKLQNADEKIDPGKSMIRYALEDGEFQIDADDSVFWVPDNNLGINENINVKSSYGTRAGMQNANVFFMNSWQESSRKDAAGNGTYSSASYLAESPVSDGENDEKNANAGEWHHVTATIQNDWVEFYVDGECVDVYDTYSSRGASTLDNSKSFKRFNKGAGMRYGFGSERSMANIRYGTYVCRLLMDWLSDENSKLCFGGIGNYASEYAQATTTSEVCIDDVKFYKQCLNDLEIKALYESENDFDRIKNEGNENAGETQYTVSLIKANGDVDNNGKINLSDAQLVLKAALNIIAFPTTSTEENRTGDVDGKGDVSLRDAQLILKTAAGIIELPGIEKYSYEEETACDYSAKMTVNGDTAQVIVNLDGSIEKADFGLMYDTDVLEYVNGTLCDDFSHIINKNYGIYTISNKTHMSYVTMANTLTSKYNYTGEAFVINFKIKDTTKNDYKLSIVKDVKYYIDSYLADKASGSLAEYVASLETADAAAPKDVSVEIKDTSSSDDNTNDDTYIGPTKCDYSATMSATGDTLNVFVSVDGNLNMFDLGVMYDSEQLTYINCSWENKFSQAYTGIKSFGNLKDMSYVVIAGSANDTASYNGQIIELQFKINDTTKNDYKLSIVKDSSLYANAYDKDNATGSLADYIASDKAPLGYAAPKTITFLETIVTGDSVVVTGGSDNVSGGSGNASGGSGNVSGGSGNVSDDKIPSPDKFLAGDANCDGKIDLNDSRLVLKIALGISVKVTEQGRKNANYDENDKIDLNDAKYTLKRALGIKFTVKKL